MLRTTEQWIDTYKKQDRLWFHGGDLNKPHAELASGNHSNGFFNSRDLDEALLQDAAQDLVSMYFEGKSKRLEDVQVVVGPQTGATKLAQFISERVERMWGNDCLTASPSKDQNGKPTIFTAKERAFIKDKRVLLCEDVITTGGSVKAAADAVVAAGGICLPFVLALVNRSGADSAHDYTIVALISRPMPIWAPDDCPLCKGGSEAIRPKDNWVRLTA